MGQTIIEVNGVKYDAVSGAVVPTISNADISTQIRHTSTAASQPVRISNGHNIDGIVSRPNKIASNFVPSKQRVVQNTQVVHKTHAQKSSTLMRRVVKKPGTEPNTEKIVVTNIQGSKSYANSAQSVARLARATNTATHINVQKFTSGHTVGATQPTVTHLHVKAAPVVATGHNYRTPPTLERYHKNSAESFVQSQLQKATMDPSKILKKKPFGGSKKKKIASLSAIAASVLLISSFLAYQNLPTITLAMASKKSGIAAGVPKGIPSNFALSRNVSATDNRIVMNFSSRTDDRNITITGEKTDISPDTLLDQINKTGKGTNHAYTVAGLKINIISAGNADWIDGNVHYNISGNSGLSSEQIATIASSL